MEHRFSLRLLDFCRKNYIYKIHTQRYTCLYRNLYILYIYIYRFIHNTCIYAYIFYLSRICKVLYALRAWARFSRMTRRGLFYSLTREERPFYLRAHISGRPVESRGIRFSRSPRALRDLITCPFALAHGYANRSVRVSRNENARSRPLRPLFSHLVLSPASFTVRIPPAPIIRLKLVAIIARIFQSNYLISSRGRCLIRNQQK